MELQGASPLQWSASIHIVAQAVVSSVSLCFMLVNGVQMVLCAEVRIAPCGLQRMEQGQVDHTEWLCAAEISTSNRISSSSSSSSIATSQSKSHTWQAFSRMGRPGDQSLQGPPYVSQT